MEMCNRRHHELSQKNDPPKRPLQEHQAISGAGKYNTPNNLSGESKGQARKPFLKQTRVPTQTNKN